jgi:NAD(P)-dependent dehydrogenase (short-subunit alcohol dehydrogenase family)
MDGKVCVVTGASSGIGRETARSLAALGARVVMVARDRDRGERARSEISHSTGSRVLDLVLCDLASQAQVRRLAAELLETHDRIHVLVNNAGLTLAERRVTEDGIETTFAVNHLAPFLLTNLLLDRLRDSAPARVVTVASDAHQGGKIDFDDLSGERRFSGWVAYAQSKLANILFTSELARRLEGTGVTANCLHPGVVHTGFGREGPAVIRMYFKIAGRFLLTPERGADTIVYLASSAEVEGRSDGYYVKRKRVEPSMAAKDRETARRLWEMSAHLTRLAPPS